jgi:hypothetical protein
VETGEREPIEARIVEVPDDLLRFESRDPRSTFTAYVPIGSLAKGKMLAMGGSGPEPPPPRYLAPKLNRASSVAF